MTAFTAIENMVRSASYSDLKNDEQVKKIISDLDSLAEVESGELRSEHRETLAQNIVTFLVSTGYISETDGFDLMNKSNPDYGYDEIVELDLGVEESDDDDAFMNALLNKR